MTLYGTNRNGRECMTEETNTGNSCLCIMIQRNRKFLHSISISKRVSTLGLRIVAGLMGVNVFRSMWVGTTKGHLCTFDTRERSGTPRMKIVMDDVVGKSRSRRELPITGIESFEDGRYDLAISSQEASNCLIQWTRMDGWMHVQMDQCMSWWLFVSV
jgi:hypothetical protein